MLHRRPARPGAHASGPLPARKSLFLALPLLLLAPAAGAQTIVSGQANIFGAGHEAPPAPGGGGGGVLPTLIDLGPGTSRTITFTDVTGSIDYGPCCPPNGADGVDATGAVAAPVWDGLAGTDFPTRSRFLVAVFLDDTEPADPAPARLFFQDGAFAELSPGLRQIFFVGDGLRGTGTGEVQVFRVPDSATRLFLGLQDRYSTDPNVPGWYGDNSGSLTLTVSVDGVATAAGEAPALPRPRLFQNVPNPFNPATTLAYEAPAGGGRVSLRIYDARGRCVRRLLDAPRAAGLHRIRWDGTDHRGRRLPAGAYACRLVTRDGQASIRMVMVP